MRRSRSSVALALAGGCAWLTLVPAARADTTDDLLQVLRDKGILSQQEFDLLRQRNAAQRQAPPAPVPPVATVPAPPPAGTPFVTMMDKGVGFHVGPVDLSFSGEVNAFYVHDMPDKGPAATTTVAGGLASTGALHSEAIRSGLLPGNFNIKLATKQEGYDIGVTFGFYPGLSSVSGVGGANSAGNPQALGTSGIDFRQQFITVGNERIGTLKMGRDIGLFGQEAILNDFTLLSVGTPSANAAPSNTSLGRIGLGYVYTDFIPQFTYTTPSFAGLQAAAGVFTPLNAVNFSTLSGTLAGHDQPQIQAKLAYAVPDGMLGPVKAKLWTNVVTQNFQASAAGQALPTGSGTRGWGVDYGAKLSAFGADVVAYGYNGDGLGSTALFFDAVDAAGRTRDSRGYYLQGTYTLFDRLLIGASYGQSHLSLASGEVNPLLFKYNESEVFGVQYKLTDWLKFVTEYTHTHAKAHGGNSASSDSVAAGSILFF